MDFPWTNALALWAGGLAVFSLLMGILYLIHLAVRNASVVDVGWGTGLALCGVFYALAADGDPTRRAIVAAMVAFYGLRLSIHLLFDRVWGHPEEGRYQQLRRDWGERFLSKLFWFYQFQAWIGAFVSLPFLLPCLDPAPAPRAVEIAAVFLWAGGLLGEAIADRQLNRFKADPANRGQVCRRGLWSWSRHPNYFFQFVMWLGFALYALPAPLGWLGLVSPLLMLHFLLNVTGIPPTEAQAVRSRGDAYREYQRTTNAFFPWPPRRSPR